MSTWNVLDDAKVVWKAADGPSVLKPVAAAASASDAPEGMDVATVEEKPAAAPFDTTGLSDELKACIDIGFRLELSDDYIEAFSDWHNVADISALRKTCPRPATTTTS